MSRKLPLIKANKVIKILGKLGFEVKRQKGSHIFLAHPDGRTTVIPNHPGEDLDRGLLNKILKHDVKIQREIFLEHF
ncbi:TPA: type II toxin-antitoxin system HicA family toxin [Candidatus Woesearchaeota archaeon]|nr:type II toxin-antitoxin system HicA family toxin [Candidatus Woesearchaeota archaeon]